MMFYKLILNVSPWIFKNHFKCKWTVNCMFDGLGWCKELCQRVKEAKGMLTADKVAGLWRVEAVCACGWGGSKVPAAAEPYPLVTGMYMRHLCEFTSSLHAARGLHNEPTTALRYAVSRSQTSAEEMMCGCKKPMKSCTYKTVPLMQLQKKTTKQSDKKSLCKELFGSWLMSAGHTVYHCIRGVWQEEGICCVKAGRSSTNKILLSQSSLGRDQQ